MGLDHRRAPGLAPQATSPIRAEISLPGSKSQTNRALILAALAATPSTISAPLHSRDTALMVQALRGLGARIDGAEDWQVTPPPELHAAGQIDCGLAGTVMRFVPPLATLTQGSSTFDGDPRARQRPMADLLDALHQLGATIDSPQQTLPFTVHGTGTLRGGTATIDASASSQFVSALLLAAPRFENGLELRSVGPSLPSAPHIEMTVSMLREAGVSVTATSDRWQVAPGTITGRSWQIEPDLSNAAPFLAAALVTNGEVTVAGWPQKTTQAGDALRDLLTAMGAGVTLDDAGLTVRGTGRIAGIDVSLHDVGELTPVIAALAALADSPSQLRGIAHLRGHETDRLAALAHELSTLGISATETADSLLITPKPLRPGVFRTYQDHRMAHAAVVLGLAQPGIQVDDIGTTSKTMPDFPERWTALVGSG